MVVFPAPLRPVNQIVQPRNWPLPPNTRPLLALLTLWAWWNTLDVDSLSIKLVLRRFCGSEVSICDLLEKRTRQLGFTTSFQGYSAYVLSWELSREKDQYLRYCDLRKSKADRYYNSFLRLVYSLKIKVTPVREDEHAYRKISPVLGIPSIYDRKRKHSE